VKRFFLCVCCYFNPVDRAYDDLPCSAETLAAVRVHGGFFGEYEGLRSSVLALVRQRLERHRQDGRRVNVYVTGHSLGGAVACLLALDLASARHLDERRPGHEAPLLERPPVVYTFGSPRLGNAAIRSVYNMLVPDTYRVVAGRDLVPTLPPSCQYRQLGREVWLDETGAATYVMSVAMRRMLPPRDDLACHYMMAYYRRLGKAFRQKYGQEFMSAFRSLSAIRDALHAQ